VLAQTKKILASKNWKHYFGALGVKLKDNAAIDQLLRFAVYNSAKKGYHRRGYHDRSLTITEVKMPPMVGGTDEVIPKPTEHSAAPTANVNAYAARNVRPSQMMQPQPMQPSNRYDRLSRANLQAQPRPQHIMAYQQQRIQMQMRRQQAHYGAMQIQQQPAMVQRQWQHQQQQQARRAVQPMMRRAPMVSSNHMNPQAQPRFMAQQCRPFGPAPAVRFGANQNAQPQFRRPMQTQQMRTPQRQIHAQTPMHSQQTRRRW